MERWRKVWRDGLAPHISNAALEVMRQALEEDDNRLIQGATTSPPPLQCVTDWPAEAVCILGFGGWQGDGLITVGDIEEYFARLCFDADQLIGEPAACRWFLDWYDEVDRDQMRRELLSEVQLVLAGRQQAPPAKEQATGTHLPEGEPAGP